MQLPSALDILLKARQCEVEVAIKGFADDAALHEPLLVSGYMPRGLTSRSIRSARLVSFSSRAMAARNALSALESSA